MQRSRLQHPTLPSLTNKYAKHSVACKVPTKHDEDPTGLTNNDLAAAHALMDLRQKSTLAFKGLMNGHERRTNRAVRSIIRHSYHNRIGRKKSNNDSKSNHQIAAKKAGLTAALALVKLSGQSRVESKAGLALLHLHSESKLAVTRAQRDQVSLARIAVEKARATEKWLALRKFRCQFPAVLRTSIRTVGHAIPETDVCIVR